MSKHHKSWSTSKNIPALGCVFLVLALIIIGGVVGIVLTRPAYGEINESNETNNSSRSEYDRPHIIFIISDDQGFNDVGWNNPEVTTPNLDELASNGIILDRNYMQPLCSPSRAALMTGKYPFRVGMQGFALQPAYPVCLDLSEKLLPEYLKDQGYATHLIGKWHLGYCNLNCTPTFRGFDSFYGYYNGEVDWYTKLIAGGFDWRDGLVSDSSAIGTYATHLLTERALDIINGHHSQTPLFMFLAYGAPHTPILVPPAVVEQPLSYEGNRANYLSMVTDMDESIGQVVQALKDKGLFENSLIVFTSDNGATLGPGSNFPLRGAKGSMYEGGTRVPAMVHGPIHSTRGVVSQGTIHSSDWLPTLAAIAGVDDDLSFMDGVDQSDMILNGGSSQRHEIVHQVHSTGAGAIRVGDYKLILGYPGSTDGWEQDNNICYTFELDLLTGENPLNCTSYQPPDYAISRPVGPVHEAFVARVEDNVLLFNVVDDPTEKVNLADTMQDKVAEMVSRLEQLKSAYIDPGTLQLVPEGSYTHFDGAWSYGYC